MDEQKRYIAITIGPIYDTLQLTSTPAGMWAASYLFSELSYELCRRIKTELKVKILTPFYREQEADEESLSRDDGVGLFPDHIIFEHASLEPQNLSAIIYDAKNVVAKRFLVDGKDANYQQKFQQYLQEYLQVHAIAFSTDLNPIIASKYWLPGIELEFTFPAQESINYLLNQFDYQGKSDKQSHNDAIKKSHLVLGLRNWPLWKDGKKQEIRDLQDIAADSARHSQPMKKYSYYAIIQADGDRMGGVIEKSTDPSRFSEECWDYSRHAAETVQKYHGVVVYAGGDDLLCIVPVENRDGLNIFNLIGDLREAFGKEFGREVGAPTLSFGVSICFYKFPLYEGFLAAHKLLADKAKKLKEEKNTLSLSLQKHSGQSSILHFFNGGGNECLQITTGLIKTLVEDAKNIPAADSKKQSERERLLNSTADKIRQFEELFAGALHNGGAAVKNCFKNTFDSSFHDVPGIGRYLDTVQKLLEAAKPEVCLSEAEEPSKEENFREEKRQLRLLDDLLWLVKFFVEPGQEKDDNRTVEGS